MSVRDWIMSQSQGALALVARTGDCSFARPARLPTWNYRKLRPSFPALTQETLAKAIGHLNRRLSLRL
jgi:hypothetical protein